MAREPIVLNFYDNNDEVAKVFSKSRVDWEFLKKAMECGITENQSFNPESGEELLQFVCDFYDNSFTKQELIQHTDIEDILYVGTQIARRVYKILSEQGVKLPKAMAAAE